MNKIRRFFKYLFNYKINNGISFYESLQLAELPVIPIKGRGIDGKEFRVNFLLDTGADFNIIDETFFNKTNIKANVKGTTSGFTTATDVQEDSTTDVVEFYVLFNNVEILSEFAKRDMKLIFDQVSKESHVNIHGILSSKFFNEHKYILDYDCCKIY